MQKLKNNWKQILVVTVIIIVCAIYVREKYFYKSLFSEKFCESIVEIQYIDYENEVYAITDEEMIDEFMTVLSENRYKRLRGADGFEGGYGFRLITEDKEYNLCLAGNGLGWKGKQYDLKDEYSMTELLIAIMQYWGIE